MTIGLTPEIRSRSGAALGEELQGAVDPRRAAGEDDDPLGAWIGRRRCPGDALGEVDEADGEDEPGKADEHAERKAHAAGPRGRRCGLAADAAGSSAISLILPAMLTKKGEGWAIHSLPLSRFPQGSRRPSCAR